MHASARSESNVSCSEDGSDSFALLVAKSNAQPPQLVAQVARVDARGVRAPYGLFQRAVTRSGVTAESGH